MLRRKLNHVLLAGQHIDVRTSAKKPPFRAACWHCGQRQTFPAAGRLSNITPDRVDNVEWMGDLVTAQDGANHAWHFTPQPFGHARLVTCRLKPERQ
jgi:hypothetical protein